MNTEDLISQLEQAKTTAVSTPTVPKTEVIFQESAEAITIQAVKLSGIKDVNESNFEQLGAVVSKAKKAAQALETLRKKHSKPLEDAKKAMIAEQRRLQEPLLKEIERVEELRNDFARKVEEERRAELRRIEEEERKRLEKIEQVKAKKGAEEKLEDWKEEKKMNTIFEAQVKKQSITSTPKNVRKTYKAEVTKVTGYVNLLKHFISTGGDLAKLDFLLKHAAKTQTELEGVKYVEQIKATSR